MINIVHDEANGTIFVSFEFALDVAYFEWEIQPSGCINHWCWSDGTEETEESFRKKFEIRHNAMLGWNKVHNNRCTNCGKEFAPMLQLAVKLF